MTRLGEILLVRGKHDEAFDLLTAASRLNPKAVSAFYLRAYLLARGSRTDEALLDLGRAAKALETDKAPVRGVTAEGDTQARLRELQHAALRKSLFGPAWDGLRERIDPAAPAPEALAAEALRVENILGELKARKAR